MITDVFVRRPVLATVLSLLILVIGARALMLLDVRQYPRTEKAVVTVSTVYTGASADLVKGFVTTPLERAIAGADGIDYLTSRSGRGLSVIRAHLRLNYDTWEALSQINSRVNRVRGDLPARSRAPEIDVQVGETTAAMYLAFHAENLPGNRITDYLRRVVQPSVETVPGVESAPILGARPLALRIWLDPSRLAAHGVTATDVRRALEANNVLATVGDTENDLVAIAARAATDLRRPAGFAGLVIREDAGRLIRLDDVAEIELGAETYDTRVTFDGRPATFLAVNVLPDANPLAVIDRVRGRFDTLRAELPPGLKAEIVHDSTDYIAAAIAEVERTLALALVVVVAVIFLFLGNLRAVTVPAVIIPLSLIGAAGVMLALGYSLNLLTLLAMVLAIGIVVDDAIIVVENVQRHVEDGMAPLDAGLRAGRELANPIIATTATLVAVYSAIGFMGGLTGALFGAFAFSLIGALVISSVIALTLSPMMASRLLRRGRRPGRIARVLDRGFRHLQQGYRRALGGAVRGRWLVLGLCLAVAAALPLMLGNITRELAPKEDQGFIIIQATGAPSASFDQMTGWAGELDRVLGDLAETDHHFVALGAGPGGRQDPSQVFGGLALTPWDQRGRTAMALKPDLQRRLAGIAGLDAAAFLPPPLPGAGEGLPIQFVIGTTGGFEILYDQVRELAQAARASGKFAFVDHDLKFDRPRVVLTVDRARAADLGLTMADLAGDLATMHGEAFVNRFNLQGRSYEVIPRAAPGDRRNPEALTRSWVRTDGGDLVPIASVISVSREVAPRQLNRFQQMDAATVSAVPAPGVSMGDAVAWFEGRADPRVRSGWAGPSRQYVQARGGLLITFGLAVVVVYLVLAALYESFRDPVVIMIAVPLALAGALALLWAGLGTLNIYTQVGLITLVALMAKHGILIVQFANRLQRDSELDRRAAVIEAAALRLRPILMTAASMIASMVPLLLASGAGAQSRFAIGLVVAGGLAIGTLFTLFVVPPVYTLVAADKRATSDDQAGQADTSSA